MHTRVIQGLFPGGRPAVQPQVAARQVPVRQVAPRPAASVAAAAIQRRGDGNGFAVDPGVLRTIGPGEPLPEALRGQMEQALGADFCDVRVHVGPQAQSIGAIAFTAGSDLYFAPGRFQPETADGRRLLGHELAHVVQQRQGRVRGTPGSVTVVQDAVLEAEAERAGVRAAGATGRPAPATRPIPTKAHHRSHTLQPMRYSRFEGFSRLVNWFASDEETQLDALERRVDEAIEGCETFVASEVVGRSVIGVDVRNLRRRLVTLRSRALSSIDLDVARRELTALLEAADRASTRLAQTIVVSERFGREQMSLDIRPGVVVAKLRELARAERLVDAGDMREMLDAVAQWASDELLKATGARVGLRDAALRVKQQVATASQLAHEAFLLAGVRQTPIVARATYLEACRLVARIGFEPLLIAPAAQTKPREDKAVSFDPGALGVAAAMVDDGFVPHLVVGLPTGGVHAANRLAAALTLITATRPALWFTRPQGVKEESRKFMADVEAPLADDEVAALSKLLAPVVKGGVLRIIVVDDGVTSGSTIVMARDLYADKFTRALKLRVEARTATVKGGRAVEWPKLTLNSATNPVDYVFNQTDDRSGPRGLLERSEPLTDPLGRTQEKVVPTTTPITVHSGRGSRTTRLKDTLQHV